MFRRGLNKLLGDGRITQKQYDTRLESGRKIFADVGAATPPLDVHALKAPEGVLNEPIRLSDRQGNITEEHNRPNLSVHGQRLKYRSDVDRVLANLRKWDVTNPDKSLKMKWLQEYAFPDKTPQEIMNHAKHPDFGLYPAVTHEARDVLGKDRRRVVDLNKVERDIGHSLHNMPDGRKPAAVVKQMRAWVDAALNRFGFTGKVVVGHREEFPEHLNRSAHPGSEAFIDPKTGTIYIDAGKHSSYADAIFTAFHEAFHRGELGSEVKPYADALIRAGKNKSVRALADRIKASYEKTGKLIPDAVAVREALADIHGALKTGKWGEIEARNGVKVSPLERASADGAVRQVIESLKRVFAKFFNRPMTNKEVLDLVDNTFRKSGQEIKTSFKGINEAVGKVGGEDIAHSLRPQEENPTLKLLKKGLDAQLAKGKITEKQHMDRVARAEAQFGVKDVVQGNSVEQIADNFLELAKDTSRAFKLSGWLIAPKLLGAVGWKVVLSPAEQAVISALRIIPAINRIAQGSRRYGGFNSHAEWEAFKSTFSKDTRQQMWQAATKGTINIDKFRELAQVSLDDVGNEAKLDRPVRDFVTRLHAALKTPLKINEFTRSTILRTQAEVAEHIANGKSPAEAVRLANSPEAQTRIGTAAYVDAQRAVMLGNNKLHDGLERLLRAGKEGDSLIGKGLAHGTELLLPVRKVPLNIGAEALEYGLGLGNAGAKLLKVGVKNLDADERDYILRNLSKQTIGLVLGYLTVKGLIAGGGYFTNDKRDYENGKPYPLSIKFAGEGKHPALAETLLHTLTHTPALDIVQAIANYQKLVGRGQTGGEAVTHTAEGFANEHAPMFKLGDDFIRAMAEQKRGSSAYQSKADKMADNIIKGFVIPGVVSSTATIADNLRNPDVTNRKTTNLKEVLQAGIPGAREQLPAYRD